VGTNPKHKCLHSSRNLAFLVTDERFCSLRDNEATLRLTPWTPCDAFSERTILSRDYQPGSDSLLTRGRQSAIWELRHAHRSQEPYHDEQHSRRGYASASPGGCHSSHGRVYHISGSKHNAVPHAVLPQRALELYAFFRLPIWTLFPRLSVLTMSADVSLMALTVSCSTTASIIQQFWYMTHWRHDRISEYEQAKNGVENPTLAIGPLTKGPSLVLFWIQVYCYNVMA
jgi:hypothetical protein